MRQQNTESDWGLCLWDVSLLNWKQYDTKEGVNVLSKCRGR